MDTVTVESIPIVLGREEDGRWWADIEKIPGVMAYGATRESTIAAVRALALCVAAYCIEQGEEITIPRRWRISGWTPEQVQETDRPTANANRGDDD